MNRGFLVCMYQSRIGPVNQLDGKSNHLYYGQRIRCEPDIENESQPDYLLQMCTLSLVGPLNRQPARQVLTGSS